MGGGTSASRFRPHPQRIVVGEFEASLGPALGAQRLQGAEAPAAARREDLSSGRTQGESGEELL